ncbi:hypothetical protein WOLCODRAFT_107442 [Wolfiporia cocos MD-104 SS10]|uniref:P-loop containing nucleoside triphosphate hydrolase protein n=1 Tax=Wolfiporia cocos (strain MD-104) TaxID=742152 RepID=A0A2H3J0M3_WOLCO|nr:hypothetical protein WOLCODRAFT_107442 [Wolfiporia cocos MD-104 SS10]
MDEGDNATGLPDSQYSSTRRDMLDIANSLYGTGVTMDIEIPMIAVIGSQSAGKSSLIESISGITLPRASGTCTRCPTECRLSSSSQNWQCLVSLRFTTDAIGQPVPVRTVKFGDPIYDKDDVSERIRRAQRAILNPSTDPRHFLNDDVIMDDLEMTFSSNCVLLEISGPDVTDLSFVDLPGLIASVGVGGNKGDIDLVKSLVTDYVSKESCIILLTVACETDFENQGAYHLAQQYDPNGKRTIGVLTKPDRIPRGDEQRWAKLLKNELSQLALVNGWYSVKQPDSVQIEAGITRARARQEEKEFFASTAPWSGLPLKFQQHLGTECLANRCSDILSALIAKSLPAIQEKIQQMLMMTEGQLNELPKEPSKDPIGEVFNLISKFSARLTKYLEGTPGADGLLQTIRPRREEFRRAISATAPDFRPHNRHREDDDNEQPTVVPLEFLANEGELVVPTTDDSAIYIDDVMQFAATAITRELPDNYPFVVTQAYIEQVVQRWEFPTRRLADEVEDILSKKVKDFVRREFTQYPHLEMQVMAVVTERIAGCAESTKERLEWLLEVESRPRTINEHHYRDYRDKILAHYKGSRPQYNNVSLLELLAGYDQASDEQRNQDLHETICKVLSGFDELGIHGVRPTDLPKVLPADPYEPAIAIMASVRAYFQVAYKRFADNIPVAIDHELVLGLNRNQGLETMLRRELGVSETDAHRICAEYLREDASVASRREDLRNKRDRLSKAKRELTRLRL